MVYKCKMCGGSINVTEKVSVAQCPYCKETQTFPMIDDEKRANLFNRANELRLSGEFDKAADIYEKIIDEDNRDSEAHWGLVLCKYGIEYVEDYRTHRRIPTCHRVQYESIAKDVDFISACKNAVADQKYVYIEQAKAIAKIQKGILAIANEESPFDVFICYKETDEYGRRTLDSALANDIYHQLTQEGFKVFYSAITLEDKLGQDYEPYIFAALNSAKVMLVIGTKPDYFNAVWVKNEWSRYLKLMKKDHSRLLIPCYRDMDPYGFPEEFAHLQAQDMSKIGFINDLVRGVKKVVGKNRVEKKSDEPQNIVSGGNVDALLKRVQIFLEDGEWVQAKQYCEKVLDIDPENAAAYIGLLLVENKVSSINSLSQKSMVLDNLKAYKKAIRFATEEAKNELKQCKNQCKYNFACDRMNSAKDENDYLSALVVFKEIIDFKDSKEKVSQCIDKSKTHIKNKIKTQENSLIEQIKVFDDASKQLSRIKKDLEKIDSETEYINEQNHEYAKKQKLEIRYWVLAFVLAFILSTIVTLLADGELNVPGVIGGGILFVFVLFFICYLINKVKESIYGEKLYNNKKSLQEQEKISNDKNKLLNDSQTKKNNAEKQIKKKEKELEELKKELVSFDGYEKTLLKNTYDSSKNQESKNNKQSLLYKINAQKCKGCTLCSLYCPTNAITGRVKYPHVINSELCVGCGQCADSCKFDAITVDDDQYGQTNENFEIECPCCGTITEVDNKTLYSGSINCPKCHELLEFELYFDKEEHSNDKYYDVECPGCGELMCIDEDIIKEGSINCPHCQTLLEFDTFDK